MEILRLDEATQSSNAEVGGKGAGLLELIRMGMPVPGGMIITTAAYEAQAARWGLHERISPLVARGDWAGVERAALEIFTAGALDENLSAAILHSYRQLNSPTAAVRSSATCEDGPDASFAGQYETFLNVRGGNELILALRKCWASLWNRRALSYRQRRSIDHLSARMAVVVQEMIPADASGVLFTVDPVRHCGDEMRVEIAAGLGEAVVSGAVTGEVHRVNRGTLKRTGGEGGLELAGPELLAELCRLALLVEGHFGSPQDIEFAVVGGKIHLLQARPMTSRPEGLVEPLDPPGKPSFLDRMMKPLVDERYAIPPRPLDNVIFTRVLVGAHIHVIREFGGVIEPEDLAAFESRMWWQAYRLPPVRRVWRALLVHSYHQFRLLKTDWKKWWDNGPRDELIAISEPVGLSTMADEELMARADRILAVWEGHLKKRILAASAIQADSLLKLLVTMAVGPGKRDGILASLMTGLENPTFVLNEELWQLSRLARRDPAVHSAVRDLAPERLEATPEGRRLLEAFVVFMNRYGHREGPCWYLTAPTWRRDPKQVWRLLGSLSEAGERTGNPEEGRAGRAAALESVEGRLRWVPGLLRVFRWTLHRLCELHTFRECSHFDLTRPLGALQEIAVEWGRRLQARGILDSEDDVGYLTYEEVREWLIASPPVMEDARMRVARRRATYRVVNARWQAERFEGAARGDLLKGIAASPGAVRGKARIIRDEQEFDRLLAGEVLVSPYTNPAWTPLFATAAAVVTETGGVSSHAAIVAREYGIPAVMAVPAATRILKDGQEILVDGNRGVVLR